MVYIVFFKLSSNYRPGFARKRVIYYLLSPTAHPFTCSVKLKRTSHQRLSKINPVNIGSSHFSFFSGVVYRNLVNISNTFNFRQNSHETLLDVGHFSSDQQGPRLTGSNFYPPHVSFLCNAGSETHIRKC